MAFALSFWQHIISDSMACPFGRQFFPILYREWAGSL